MSVICGIDSTLAPNSGRVILAKEESKINWDRSIIQWNYPIQTYKLSNNGFLAGNNSTSIQAPMDIQSQARKKEHGSLD
jgi:hypothetical protein